MYADIRILEYSGLDQVNPVDVTAAAIGTNATSNSGAATTTNANDLIVGANIVYTSTTGPGTGFTKRMITSPDGDIAEDRVVTTAGSYSASAPLIRSGPWIMQMVAFKAASGGTVDSSPPTSPSNLLATAAGTGGINLSWTASSDNVGVTNYLIERCQGPGCSSFAQVATSSTTTFSDTGLLSSTSYSYRITSHRCGRQSQRLFERIDCHNESVHRKSDSLCPGGLCGPRKPHNSLCRYPSRVRRQPAI